MEYSYTGYTASKSILKGKVTAANEKAAVELLKRRGCYVLNLKPVASSKFDLKKQFPSLFQIKAKNVIFFARQLALFLESGRDIVASLELLRSQVSNHIFKAALGDVISDLRSGERLSVALSKHPEIFPLTYCRSLGAGEQTAGMELMLRQIADYMERDLNVKKRMKGAMRYPIIVSIVAFLVVIVLVTFVMPTFVGLFETMGAELPLVTKMFISASDILRNYGLYMLAIIVLAVISVMLYIRTPTGRYKWDKMALTLPMLGEINLLGELSYCCRVMSMLFRGGVPIVEIMDMSIQSTSNRAMKEALLNVKQAVLKGQVFQPDVRKSPVFADNGADDKGR